MNKIFLDDERDPPDDTWLVFRTAPRLIKHLADVGGGGRTGWDGMTLSLDHDLGDPEAGTGYDVVSYLEEFYHWAANQDQFIPDMTIYVHSQNPVGRAKMVQGISNIYKIIEDYG